jgi:predicted hotdog family 3-hydroxylacyl-ACP dehydratase
MLISKDYIENYIPQRDPFIMIDALLSANEERFCSSFVIRTENIFLFNGILSDVALVENIAQTCAAGFGYIGSQNNETEARLGFIGAVSRLQVFEEAKAEENIETTVNILNRFENIYLVEGIATRNGTALLKCQMKIVRA